MLNILKSVNPSAIVTAVLLCASTTRSYAKPESPTEEGETCAYCHLEAGKP
jgi:hypothetical protein